MAAKCFKLIYHQNEFHVDFAEEIFGFLDAVHITDGFLLPGKRDGAVYLADLRNESDIVITDITTGAFGDDGKSQIR